MLFDNRLYPTGHLNEGQKGIVALELVPLYEEQGRREKARAVAEANARQPKRSSDVADRPHLKPEPKKRAPLSRDRAAKAVGTSGRTVARAKRIQIGVGASGFHGAR